MTLPYGRQDISDDDVAAVVAALRSDYLTQGPAVPAFERAVADHVGVPHAIAVNSATSALHIGCLALGLGEGDFLWTTPNTFVASANCARYCGADVDFVDIDPETQNIDVTSLADRLVAARKSGQLPKIVVPVHFAGRPVEQEAIYELAREFGFSVMEDASHAIGASRRGELVGTCRWSDLTVFSFHPVKVVTTAEGGLVTTRNDEIARKLELFRSHGITRDASLMERPDEGAWYYEQHALGFNYRMTDIQAALGISQMARLEQFVSRRNELAARYDKLLAGLPLARPPIRANEVPAWHLYVVQLAGGAEKRRAVFDAMRKSGIFVQVHYIPVHLQPYYRRLGFKPGDYPHAEAYYDRALTLPLFPAMSDDDQDRVVETLADALR